VKRVSPVDASAVGALVNGGVTAKAGDKVGSAGGVKTAGDDDAEGEGDAFMGFVM
jgi:hypothetical protein